MEKVKLKIIVFLLVSSYVLIATPVANAADFETGINPSIFQMEAEAPALIKTPITLTNSSDQTITYGIFLRPFTANAEKNGEPNYEQPMTEKYKEFFNNVQINDDNDVITEVSLAPQESKNLTLRINIPKNEEPGDKYFTVVFLAQNKDKGSGSSMAGARGGIGTNVLLTIGSKAKPSGRIANLSVPKFITGGPVKFTLDLANHSDYYVTTNGNVVIKNMFGQPVGNLEFGPFNILSGTNRLASNTDDPNDLSLVWNEGFLLGIYKAEANVALSDRGPLLRETQTFFAFPIKLGLITIGILIIGTWLFRRARKKNENS